MARRTRNNRHRRSPQQQRNVYVHSYSRYRYGRWEDVTDHYRSLPTQLTLDF